MPPADPTHDGAKRDPASALDQTEWPLKMSILAYGVRIAVRVNDPEIAARLNQHLPPGAGACEYSDADADRVYSFIIQADEAGERYGALYADRSVVVRRMPLDPLLRVFESNSQLHIAEAASEHVFVHAGVVGWQGRAILIPGRSFSGKTTLVAALVQAGADYYSDEYAVLDNDGLVHPYPRPLSVREPGKPGITRKRIDTLGGQIGTRPIPPGLVVVSRFKAGSEWQPRLLTPGRGALELVANTVPARRVPARMLAALERVVSVAPVVTGDRPEAVSVTKSILSLATAPSST